MRIKYTDLAVIDYQEAWDYQEQIFEKTVSEKLNNQKTGEDRQATAEYNLLFCEHPHVYTLGKSGEEQNMLISGIELRAKNATFVKTNRGGDITYHGPGQIVVYPIIDIEAFGMGVRKYIESLEEAIIRTLKHYDIKSELLDSATGVWIDSEIPGKARKIAAVGVRTSHYVSMHGFALNVNTDLAYFGYINPCGFTDKAVTSLEKELGRKVDMEEVKNILLKELTYLFNWDMES
ncbi:MAG: lipoyl(octanoyl) transferase LipB [Bacteroidales bacterium]|nr:lipoyl(octanoyl) transferase LipB [Bacteroidales bacterium]